LSFVTHNKYYVRGFPIFGSNNDYKTKQENKGMTMVQFLIENLME